LWWCVMARCAHALQCQAYMNWLCEVDDFLRADEPKGK
jgi:hypothetical protein